ncbi:MAG TPA: Trk family potassium uptake protein [Syntrophomonas sp.]|jgi:trk system potassium uptake protein TrkH|nr:Trk family potassium uptake protein [Syntrophomonas sp.]
MGSFRLSPPQVVAGGFILLIILGSLLLATPWATANGESDGLTAVFTATSAVCVTGLIVEDTATYWSFFGQVVIMLLMQLGGLSIMAMATFYALLFGKRIALRQRMFMQAAINKSSPGGIVSLFRYLIIFSLGIELAGALLLTLHWIPQMGFTKALYFGLFHSISAFNNGGFDLFGNFASLSGFRTDALTNLVISILIIAGGLGFVVIAEIISFRSRGRFSLHSKIVLSTTAVLLLLGTLFILVAEYNHALQELSFPGKVLTAYFHSVTRTAGFVTMDITTLFQGTQFLMILLMFIGGSPGSTAGGMKTVTFTVVWAAILSQMQGKKDVEIFRRRIPQQDVIRALAIIAMSGFYVCASILLLTFIQGADSLNKIVFEVVSAFATVGLSLNYTPELNTLGRLMIILTMFVGRVGPLTLAVAFAQKERQVDIRYAEEEVMIG